MGSDHSTALHSLFELPLEDAVSRFTEMRESYLKAKADQSADERQRAREKIHSFADELQSRIADVRRFHPLYRIRPMSSKILPLRHRYDMHVHFPRLMRTIPVDYSGLGVQFDSERHLAELEEAVCKERALALGSCGGEN